jgi:hypothetical protein
MHLKRIPIYNLQIDQRNIAEMILNKTINWIRKYM